jgi:hypothetical protein
MTQQFWRKNHARCEKTTQKIYLQKPLTRAKIMWYNFGAKWQTKVFIFGQNKTRY